MKVLVLGGTQFIGRHIVETLLATGHKVSILTRGKSPDELPHEVERLRGDRDQGARGVAALLERSWDVGIDVCGYTPRQVRPSAEMLRDSVRRYVFVSAVAVYGDPQERPVRETHPRVLPAPEDETRVEGELYGRLKVACEDIVREIFAARCAILRPQIVVGPHDPSGRYAYWVERAIRGGEMLAPGDGSDHLQVIDVRDLVRFVVTVIEHNLSGPFNLAGPRFTWAKFMKLLQAEKIAWVDAETIKAAGVTEFELPLFRPEHGPRSGLMDISSERALDAGLRLTDPDVTMRDVRTWLSGKLQVPALSPQREAELIRLSRHRQ